MAGSPRVALLVAGGAIFCLAWAAAAAPGWGPGLGPDAACSVQETQEEPAVLAPATNEINADHDSTGWGCYVVYGIPSFPFRGVVTATLSDGANTASWTQTCYLTGLSQLDTMAPLVGCEGVLSGAPALDPGLLHLHCTATPLAMEPAAVGTWGCAVGFGQPG